MQDWFKSARFGMFIHWGASSQRGWELSWPLVGGIGVLPQGQSISVDEYHATAATFDPVRFNPREWARKASRAGMAVLIQNRRDFPSPNRPKATSASWWLVYQPLAKLRNHP